MQFLSLLSVKEEERYMYEAKPFSKPAGAGKVLRTAPQANQLTFSSSLVSLICTGRQWNIYKEPYRQLD